MNETSITILGASSHIAKGLIYNFQRSKNIYLHLYTTSPDRTCSFVHDVCKLAEGTFTIHSGYDDFATQQHDVVINCIGVGTSKKLSGDFAMYFAVGEKYDNMVIEYLQNRSPETLYISFSSGAVYGRSFAEAVTEWSENKIRVNHVVKEDYYSICRLYSEAKHRALNHLRIIDLRLFSYFSRFIDLSEGYFITDVIESVKNNTVLQTDASNIIRDFVHPKDLFALIMKCWEAGNINDAYDVISACPVEKKEILQYFSDTYRLKYNLSELISNVSPTGAKNVYFSKYNKAVSIGYIPTYTSIDTITQEAKYLLAYTC